MLKFIMLGISFIFFTFKGLSQDEKSSTVPDSCNYAFIKVSSKSLSKKLSVEVELGDSNGQEQQAKGFNEILNNKKSYAAILNYMASHGFVLQHTLDLTSSFQGSGGTTGMIFIMRKMK